MAGNGKSLEGRGGGRGGVREGFSDKLSGSADIGGNCQYTNNRILQVFFFTFCALYIDQ